MGATLYVTDLDGTLLSKEERVPAYSREKLNRLVGEGLLFTFATARSLLSAQRATDGLNLNLPFILYNGGLIYDPVARKAIFHALLEEEWKRYLLSVLREYEISPMVFGAVGERERLAWHTGRESYGIRRYLQRRAGDDRLFPTQREDVLLDGNVFYFKCIGPAEQLGRAWDLLKYDPRFICIFHPETYSSDYWLEIFPRAATKANGVKFLKQYLGAERAVCFGDTSNDSDMFDICDEKYAVMNADDWLKAKATGVIGYCEEDGVAKWLEEHFRKPV